MARRSAKSVNAFTRPQWVAVTTGQVLRGTPHLRVARRLSALLVVVGLFIPLAIIATSKPAQAQTSDNLAEGKPATQSSTGFGGAAERAADGDTSGVYSQGSVSHTRNLVESWWEVDLGSVQEIDEIVVWNRTDCCTGRLQNFHVFVSDTPFTSTTVAGTQAQPGVTTISHPTTVVGSERFSVGRTGQFVRVQLNQRGILALAEVQVLAPEIESVDIANGRPASQSSTLFQGAADRAVDANNDGVFGRRSVTHTANESQPWWEVDLGGIADLEAVTIWNRTDCCLSRLKNFHVFVSDTPFVSDTVAGTQAQPGVTDIAFPGVASTTEVLPLNRSGRYVRVQLSGVGMLSMAEVDVFGQPPTIDDAAPVSTLTSPADGATMPTGQFDIAGAANDNVGIARVDVSIQDSANAQYLQADGSFAAAPATLEAAVTPPGAAFVDWSLAVDLPIGSYAMTYAAVDTSANTETAHSASFSVTDAIAPTVPAGLTTIETTNSAVTLTWDPSTDNFGTERYLIYRDGVLVGQTLHAGITFHEKMLAANTTYSYEVAARDAAGNQSARSSAVPATTDADTDFLLADLANPSWQVDGTVYAILPVGDTVYIGGDFDELFDHSGARLTRNNLAALDRTTGQPTPFDPNLDDTVYALATSTDLATLYVGGSFDASGGITRESLAAFDRSTGLLTDFEPPTPNGSVRAIATDGSLLYIGGTFNRVGVANRLRLAAYDLASETLDTTWTPTADQAVKGIIADPDRIWLGGSFNNINGIGAKALAAVDPLTGALLPTDHPIFPVLAITAVDDRLFVAGAGPGGRAAAYDRITGAEQWIHSTDGNVQAVGAVGRYAYFGGHYVHLDGVDVGRVTRIDIETGELDTNWLPDVNGFRSVNVIGTDQHTVYIGGDFSRVSSIDQDRFAMFVETDLSGIAPRLDNATMFDTDANGYIDTVEVVFDQPLASCVLPCSSGWTLHNVPSDGSLHRVFVDGNTATMHLHEGLGEPDTGVTTFRVSLSRGSNIRGENGLHAKFPKALPLDAALPQPIEIRKTNIGIGGLAEQGDTLTILWSEQLDPASVPLTTDVVISDPADGGNDQLSAAGFIDGSMDLGSADFVICPDGPCTGAQSASFIGSALELNSGGRLLTATLAACSGECDLLMPAPEVTVTYDPAPNLTDLSGNVSQTTVQKTFFVF